MHCCACTVFFALQTVIVCVVCLKLCCRDYEFFFGNGMYVCLVHAAVLAEWIERVNELGIV